MISKRNSQLKKQKPSDFNKNNVKKDNQKNTQYESVDAFFQERIQRTFSHKFQTMPIENVLAEIDFLKKLENFDKREVKFNKKLIEWKKNGMGKIKGDLMGGKLDVFQTMTPKSYLNKEIFVAFF